MSEIVYRKELFPGQREELLKILKERFGKEHYSATGATTPFLHITTERSHIIQAEVSEVCLGFNR